MVCDRGSRVDHINHGRKTRFLEKEKRRSVKSPTFRRLEFQRDINFPVSVNPSDVGVKLDEEKSVDKCIVYAFS